MRLACINHNGAEGRYRATRAWNVIFSLTTVNTKLPRAFIVECATTLSRVGNGVSMTQRYQIVWRDAKWEDVTRVKRGCYAVASRTQGKRLQNGELRSRPEKVAGSSFAFTWDFDYRDYKVGSAKSERQICGRGYYPVMYCPFRSEKTTRPFCRSILSLLWRNNGSRR